MSEINELKELIITLTKEVQELKLEVLKGKSTKSKKEVKSETYDINGNMSQYNYSTEELKEMIGEDGDIGISEFMLIKLYKYGKFSKLTDLQRFTDFDKEEIQYNLELLKDGKLVFESKKYFPTSWIITDKGRDFIEGKL